MTKILAPKIFACLNMVSAETCQDVMTAMNAQTTLALLPLMEKPTLALILLALALKMQLSSMPTLYYFLIKKKLNGWVNVIRRKDALVVLSMLNAIITKDV